MLPYHPNPLPSCRPADGRTVLQAQRPVSDGSTTSDPVVRRGQGPTPPGHRDGAMAGPGCQPGLARAQRRAALLPPPPLPTAVKLSLLLVDWPEAAGAAVLRAYTVAAGGLAVRPGGRTAPYCRAVPYSTRPSLVTEPCVGVTPSRYRTASESQV
eukprot:764691-Hanusia_phi.AAC.4